jgi:hypothetical protein
MIDRETPRGTAAGRCRLFRTSAVLLGLGWFGLAAAPIPSLGPLLE